MPNFIKFNVLFGPAAAFLRRKVGLYVDKIFITQVEVVKLMRVFYD